MPTSRPPYAPEFRQEMVKLVRSGRSPEELAKEYEPSSQTIPRRIVMKVVVTTA